MKIKRHKKEKKSNRIKVFASVGEQLEGMRQKQRTVNEYFESISLNLDRFKEIVQPGILWLDYNETQIWGPELISIPYTSPDYFVADNVVDDFVVATPVYLKDNSLTAAVQEKISEARRRLRETRDPALVLEIRKLLVELRAIVKQFVSNYCRSINAFERFITYRFRLDRQFVFRRVIQFLFKNMDDESGPGAYTFALVKYVPNHQINIHLYEAKRKPPDIFNRADHRQ